MAATSGPPWDFPHISGWIVTTRQQTGHHQDHHHPWGSLQTNLYVVSNYTLILFKEKSLESLWQNRESYWQSFLSSAFTYDSHIFITESCSFGLVIVQSEVSHSQMYRQE